MVVTGTLAGLQPRRRRRGDHVARRQEPRQREREDVRRRRRRLHRARARSPRPSRSASRCSTRTASNTSSPPANSPPRLTVARSGRLPRARTSRRSRAPPVRCRHRWRCRTAARISAVSNMRNAAVCPDSAPAETPKNFRASRRRERQGRGRRARTCRIAGRRRGRGTGIRRLGRIIFGVRALPAGSVWALIVTIAVLTNPSMMVKVTSRVSDSRPVMNAVVRHGRNRGGNAEHGRPLRLASTLAADAPRPRSGTPPHRGETSPGNSSGITVDHVEVGHAGLGRRNLLHRCSSGSGRRGDRSSDR